MTRHHDLIAKSAIALLALVASTACFHRGVAPSSDGVPRTQLASNRTSSPPSPCTVSGKPKSALAVESAKGGGELRGRVVWARTLKPIAMGVARLDPGNYRAVPDANGAFRFTNVPTGRYLLSVTGGNGPSAADSVTLGKDGLFVLASMAELTAPEIASACASSSARRR